MSDRSSATLTVLAVPQENLGATFEAITEWYETDEIVLGEPIYMEEQGLDIVANLGSTLIELGVTFDLYQDAKWEWDGEGLMAVPSVGEFRYTGGGSGEPMVLVSAVQELIDASGTNGDPTDGDHGTMDAIRDLIGSTVMAAWKALLEEADGQSLKRPAVTE